jgi:hypothetical protein
MDLLQFQLGTLSEIPINNIPQQREEKTPTPDRSQYMEGFSFRDEPILDASRITNCGDLMLLRKSKWQQTDKQECAQSTSVERIHSPIPRR